MKISLAIVLCLAALAYGRPAKPEGNPLVGKVLGFCLRLLEEAVDDPEKRSWDDVFGALAPVCEDLLKMGGPRGDKEGGSGDGKPKKPESGSGDGRPERPEGGSGDGRPERPEGGSGDRGRPERPDKKQLLKRYGGKEGGSGDGRPERPDRDGSGDDGSGDDAGKKLFMGLYRVCSNLHDLFEASQDKRSWEEIFMTLYEVCEEAKAKVEQDREDDDDEDDLDRRPPTAPTQNESGKGGMGPGGRGGDQGGRGGDQGGRGSDQGGRGGDQGGRGGDKEEDRNDDGSGDDEQYRLGYKTVMSLIRLCEGMAALGDHEPPEDADPEWVAIFTRVGEVCVATHEQIQADMAGKEGERSDSGSGSGTGSGSGDGGDKRMMEGGKGKMKPEGGDDDNEEKGSGDRKPEMPENRVEALLDVCESLLELEKEVLERRENKITVDVIAGLMKDVCEQAFAQAEEDEKKKKR